MKKLVVLFSMAFLFASCQEKQVQVNGESIELTEGIHALINTNQGDILFKFDTENAPMTSANFILLAEGKMPYVKEELKEKPYFDGLTFHRVIPKFMIQGGDPAGNGSGGPGYEFPNETSQEVQFDSPGVVAMANAGPGTNGSQFFITHNEVPHLNGGYSIFGKVEAGQDVVVKIGDVEKGAQDKPVEDVVMTKVNIIRIGSDAKSWNALEAYDNTKAELLERDRLAREEAMKKREEAEKAEAERLAAMKPLFDENVARFEKLKAKATTTESGLMYVIHSKGNGPKPMKGDMLSVHYAGYLFEDGRIFDTSIKELAEKFKIYNPAREPYPPFSVQYGDQARVIEGWKEGLQLLRRGGKATLIIPPHLGYGAQGAGGVIPPNATLVFDVEVQK